MVNASPKKLQPNKLGKLEEALAKTNGNTGQREEKSSTARATPPKKELPININFIDEDGEVSKVQTTKNEETSHIFDKYAIRQGAPFILSLVMYEFRYNDRKVPLDVTIGSIKKRR